VVLPAVVLISVVWASVGSSKNSGEFRLRDDCDPATFGPNCIGDGDTTLNEFNAELAAKGRVDDWKFQPDHFETRAAQPVILVNRGGLTHTYTRVAGFGGSFVARLNAASGNLIPAPECAKLAADGVTLIRTPASSTNIAVPAQTQMVAPGIGTPGTVRFQCCIHPWMRSTATVR
jgi:hypothetical protein